ncbi:MAG: amidohydrolase family protein [Vicinamibacteria bacterium]
MLVAAFILLSGFTAQPRADSFGPPEPPFVPGAPIAIRGGTLIDATGGAPRLDHAVLIEGDRIRWVGPMEDLPLPEGAVVIDASGMTVLPGLINSNQHIQLNPLYPAPEGGLPLQELEERWEDTFRRMPDRAFHYLMQGVTSMRQTSGPAKRLLTVKQAIDSGEIPGPRIYLGGALLMSPEHWQSYLERQKTPAESAEWLMNEFAFSVIEDVDKDTDQYVGEEFPYWKLLMSGERYDGKNDFTDDELRFIIDKAHRNGKTIDVHCGGHNDGLRRMMAFDVDTLEHPFYGNELIEEEIIRGYVDKNVIVATLLTVMVSNAERAADPHRFSETLYAMSMEPKEYRVLMRYRDKMLANMRRPDAPGVAIYESPSGAGEEAELGLDGPSFENLQKRRLTSRENMRRFIRAGARFSMGTDTPAFLNFIQEDPNANEIRYMVELGMSPMNAIEASTRIGAEALGMEKDLGTIEEGKLADVIVVAGNPLLDMRAMKRVYAVIKGGVRYK